MTHWRFRDWATVAGAWRLRAHRGQPWALVLSPNSIGTTSEGLKPRICMSIAAFHKHGAGGNFWPFQQTKQEITVVWIMVLLPMEMDTVEGDRFKSSLESRIDKTW